MMNLFIRRLLEEKKFKDLNDLINEYKSVNINNSQLVAAQIVEAITLDVIDHELRNSKNIKEMYKD